MRRLTLRKDTLTELAPARLRGVVGGTHVACGFTDDVRCITRACTDACTDGCGHGASIDQTCPTVPPTGCVQVVGSLLDCIATS